MQKILAGQKVLEGTKMPRTAAWLISENPTLKISPHEQLEFMKRFWRNELSVSKKSVELTKLVLYLETSPRGYRFHGKTGFGLEKNLHTSERIGWFIGHVENQEKSVEFISVVGFTDQDATSGRGYGGLVAKEMTKAYFVEMGLW